MSHRRKSVMGIAAATLAFNACGLSGGSQNPAPEQQITLSVKNQNFYDATLYAVWDTYNFRIGRVASNETQTFTMAWRPQDLRISINLQSVGSYLTLPMTVARGDELELYIEPSLDKHIQLLKAGRGP
ncbi:MAG: hypothetical protein ACE5HT_06380 [Gemmatimonadales bacterium]